MKGGFYAFWRVLMYPTRLHILCGIGAVVCCVPIIFPEICPADSPQHITSYAGGTLLCLQGTSTAFMVLAVVIHMFRLSNTRAFSQLFKWMLVWATCVSVFILLALAADVQPPASKESTINSHPFVG